MSKISKSPRTRDKTKQPVTTTRSGPKTFAIFLGEKQMEELKAMLNYGIEKQAFDPSHFNATLNSVNQAKEI